MRTSPERIAVRLSIIVALLLGGASAAGLAIPGLYRDNALVVASWYGNDLVSLLVATPLLVATMIGARRGRLRARLGWMGMLLYSLYNGAFYLFGATFNALFLVYVALFTGSAFALIFGLAALDVEAVAERMRDSLPARGVAAFMGAVGLTLGGFHGVVSLRYGVTGATPPMVEATGLHTNLIAALDLSMVVSVALLGSVWLWRRRPWGVVLAVLWSVKGAVYMLALSAATVSTLLAGAADAWQQLLLWGPIGVGCLGASILLLRALGPEADAATA